jgi:nucleoside-diphosphate-sugar epimerase
MTRVAVIGADGMIGRKLVERLCADGAIAGTQITQLIVCDIRAPRMPVAPFTVTTLVGDMSNEINAEDLAAWQPEIVFHVAATFMGQADLDFSAGYRINFFTAYAAIDAIRRALPLAPPRFVYASSIGVYGPPFPDLIDDDYPAQPDSSYGTQKLMCEAIINDYSRLGFIDGIALRLPTIAIRPGPATHGNSGFFSNIIREPLEGRRALLPASTDVVHWIASPNSAVDYLLHAARLDTAKLGQQRALVMPGLAVSVTEQLQVLAEIGGSDALALIDRLDPPSYGRESFPRAFTAARALELGFRPSGQSFADIVAEFSAGDSAKAAS